MPANRSRTLEWRRCLKQIVDRNGAIEIAIDNAEDDSHEVDASNLIWRVRVFDISDSGILIEHPSTMGHLVPLSDGVELVAIMAIGQNRWMFRTKNLGTRLPANGKRPATTEPTLMLSLPINGNVERCQRRRFDRVDTADLRLPQVDAWPLFDPASVVLAERANEVRMELARSADLGASQPAFEPDDVMPEVGPHFTATLSNIGGGGIGLLVAPKESQAILRHKLFWLSINLPELPVPICATGKIVHTHLESSQHVYAGLAFDFTFNHSHQGFVIEQIRRYIAVRQREQAQRRQALMRSA